MPTYKHRQTEVEAVRWMGPSDTEAVRELVDGLHREIIVRSNSQWTIHIEGQYTGTKVSAGDWVVVDGSEGLSVYPHATFVSEYELPDDEA